MIYIADPFASTIQSDPVLKYGHNVHINGVSVLRRVKFRENGRAFFPQGQLTELKQTAGNNEVSV